MGILSGIRKLFGPRGRECEHAALIEIVEPSSPDSCDQCLALGDTWVNLRVCLICGLVGCCDNSKNTHATKHYQVSGHPVIQSYQPGEGWRYCYPDNAKLPEAEPFR
jgi:uncharacterized UBP type Zn finger protein